jgi:hypothetical protein
MQVLAAGQTNSKIFAVEKHILNHPYQAVWARLAADTGAQWTKKQGYRLACLWSLSIRGAHGEQPEPGLYLKWLTGYYPTNNQILKT